MRYITCYTQKDVIVLKDIAEENLGWIKRVSGVKGRYTRFSLHSLNPKYVDDIYFKFLKWKKSKK